MKYRVDVDRLALAVPAGRPAVRPVLIRASRVLRITHFVIPRLSSFFDGPPQPRCLAVQPCLLERVHGVPDEALKSLNLCLPLGNRRIMSRPLTE